MDLEEDDDGADGGVRGGVLICLFYNEAGHAVDADQGQGFMPLDHHEFFMDQPYVPPEDFNRGVDLDG